MREKWHRPQEGKPKVEERGGEREKRTRSDGWGEAMWEGGTIRGTAGGR